MILAKVQMQFLSGPKFTDVEIVDSCPRYSSQLQLRSGLGMLPVRPSVCLWTLDPENRAKDFDETWYEVKG